MQFSAGLLQLERVQCRHRVGWGKGCGCALLAMAGRSGRACGLQAVVRGQGEGTGQPAAEP